jgi:uroporphyrinogen decarboxylase
MITSLNRRDAVFASLRFEQQAPCPYYIWIDDRMVPPLAERYGAESFVGAPGSVRTFAGSYTAMTEVAALPIEDRGESYVDEFGATIRRGAELGLQRPALGGPSLAGYRFPDLTTPPHFAHLDAWFRQHAERFRIVQLGMLLFERSWFMRGMQNILMDFHSEPAFAHELFDRLEAVCAALIGRLLADYGDRIDAIGLSEDYGSQKSLLISPRHWREFIKPRLARLVGKIRGAGKQAYIHSCGHVLPVIGDLVEIGVTMLQPIQPEAMDVFEVKRRFGKDLCLMGGISTQQTLHHGSPAEVVGEVRACLTHLATGGGYVMAPAKPILPGVPVENAAALIDAFVHQQPEE